MGSLCLSQHLATPPRCPHSQSPTEQSSSCWPLRIFLTLGQRSAEMSNPQHPATAAGERACLAEGKSALFRALDSLPGDTSGSGFSHLGTDGVWRNYDGNRKVISYRPLSPEEIAEVLAMYPAWMREMLESQLEGVDGRSVTDVEQLMNPASEVGPNFEDDGNEDGNDKINGGRF
ncbi:hypothetical protein BJX68DRAFT_249616 [Aspergillus pseudodeflectus]|uniref:Uncharacterized protein n=1 Tax=Aspergillus pseudodeflectus TaxID=176178 RepID=A0ABR4JCH8_9EURO